MTTIAIVLTTLWLVSLANGYTMGGYIHLLPIIVIIGGILTLSSGSSGNQRSRENENSYRRRIFSAVSSPVNG